MLTLLFVCTGNICRSPLAEAFARDRSRYLPGDALRIDSAGTWADEGRPPMPETIAVAVEHTLDLSGKVAHALSEERVRSADLIVTTTSRQRREVVAMAPEAAQKTFTLKELAGVLAVLPPLDEPADRETALARVEEADAARGPEFEGDVLDPIGMPVGAYRDVAREIEMAVDGIFTGLFGIRAEQRAAGGG